MEKGTARRVRGLVGDGDLEVGGGLEAAQQGLDFARRDGEPAVGQFGEDLWRQSAIYLVQLVGLDFIKLPVGSSRYEVG